jgi:hypothetical protein
MVRAFSIKDHTMVEMQKFEPILRKIVSSPRYAGLAFAPARRRRASAFKKSARRSREICPLWAF